MKINVTGAASAAPVGSGPVVATFCGIAFTYDPLGGTWTSADGAIVVQRCSRYCQVRPGSDRWHTVLSWAASDGGEPFVGLRPKDAVGALLWRQEHQGEFPDGR